MVNNGRIHEELSYFSGVLQNSIKSDDKLRWEIRNFGIYRNKTPWQIQIE